MYNHNKAQQSKNRVHISWDILYGFEEMTVIKWYLKHGSLNGMIMFATIKVNKFRFVKIISKYEGTAEIANM